MVSISLSIPLQKKKKANEQSKSSLKSQVTLENDTLKCIITRLPEIDGDGRLKERYSNCLQVSLWLLLVVSIFLWCTTDTTRAEVGHGEVLTHDAASLILECLLLSHNSTLSGQSDPCVSAATLLSAAAPSSCWN